MRAPGNSKVLLNRERGLLDGWGLLTQSDDRDIGEAFTLYFAESRCNFMSQINKFDTVFIGNHITCNIQSFLATKMENL